MSPDRFSRLFGRVREIIETARATAARSVNTAHVAANWLIGREIVEEEQHGMRRAGYGRRILVNLSKRLSEQYGRGYSFQNLSFIRQFFQRYPHLLGPEPILYTACRESSGLSPSPLGAGDA
ncbi:MAG: DUF1016 N-terminal domain-containing protein [Elusimicrobiota bacterium]